MLEDTKTATLIRSAVQAYPMSDAELGSVLTRIAQNGSRQLQALDDTFVSEGDKTYLNVFFAHILPEIAARLMERDGIHMGQKRSPELKDVPAQTLRRAFAEVFGSEIFENLIKVAASEAKRTGTLRDIDLATAQAVNGNIGLIALDRLAPPASKDDLLGALIRLTGSIRGMSCPEGMWYPGMAREQLDDYALHAGAAQISDILLEAEDLEVIDATPELALAG